MSGIDTEAPLEWKFTGESSYHNDRHQYHHYPDNQHDNSIFKQENSIFKNIQNICSGFAGWPNAVGHYNNICATGWFLVDFHRNVKRKILSQIQHLKFPQVVLMDADSANFLPHWLLFSFLKKKVCIWTSYWLFLKKEICMWTRFLNQTSWRRHCNESRYHLR